MWVREYLEKKISINEPLTWNENNAPLTNSSQAGRRPFWLLPMKPSPRRLATNNLKKCNANFDAATVLLHHKHICNVITTVEEELLNKNEQKNLIFFSEREGKRSKAVSLHDYECVMMTMMIMMIYVWAPIKKKRRHAYIICKVYKLC